MKRPDDQTWWQRFTRQPSPGQRGWDWGHEFVRRDPSPKDFRDCLTSHETNLHYDPTEFDRQFGIVFDYWETHGCLPEDAPAEVVVVTPLLTGPQPSRYDCAVCGCPGMECDDLDLCPCAPKVNRR